MDEHPEKVTVAEKVEGRVDPRGARKRSSRKSRGRRKRGEEFLECTKGVPTLEECTKNIVEGGNRRCLSNLDLQDVTGCICSEIAANFRLHIGKKSEATGCSRSPSPEMTHTIRIAMKQHDRSACGVSDDEETEGNRRSRPETNRKNRQRTGKEVDREECSNGVQDTLNFTLNCSGLRLACRDTNLSTEIASEKQQKSKIRN
ncbi:uncharacterized protein LOC117609039 [Osmia lignaria lignaria]|uniref:uncharacterized protein LOC117609039 n=1 Tax=Osmia lignaria lignaria TaxID=1437193 RepID=UPI0014785C20|nr:uncharacterized protein LOC117609039 [Osmia lignaria]